jgi:hypothetical protein
MRHPRATVSEYLTGNSSFAVVSGAHTQLAPAHRVERPLDMGTTQGNKGHGVPVLPSALATRLSDVIPLAPMPVGSTCATTARDCHVDWTNHRNATGAC